MSLSDMAYTNKHAYCRMEITAELSPRLKSLKDLYSCWSDDEIVYTVIGIVKVLRQFSFQ